MSNVINSGMRLAGILVVAALTIAAGIAGLAALIAAMWAVYWHQDFACAVLGGIVLATLCVDEAVLWRIRHFKFDVRGLAVVQVWTFHIRQSLESGAVNTVALWVLLLLLRALGVPIIRDFNLEGMVVISALLVLPFALYDLTRTVHDIRRHIASAEFENTIPSEIVSEQYMKNLVTTALSFLGSNNLDLRQRWANLLKHHK